MQQKNILNQNVGNEKTCSECGKMPATVENELCGFCWQSHHITELHTQKQCFIVGNEKHPQNKSPFHWTGGWDYLDELRSKKENKR